MTYTGINIGIDQFGISASISDIKNRYGFNIEATTARINNYVKEL